MPYVQLGIQLSKELGLKSVSINYNDTGLSDDSELIYKLAYTILKAIHLNKEDVAVQDLLGELGIERSQSITGENKD